MGSQSTSNSINTLNARYLVAYILYLPSPRFVSPDIAPALEQILSTLLIRERNVISLRFGLYSANGGSTLAETGKELHLTGERVRQIQKTALRRLRHPSRSSLLRKYITAEVNSA